MSEQASAGVRTVLALVALLGCGARENEPSVASSSGAERASSVAENQQGRARAGALGDAPTEADVLGGGSTGAAPEGGLAIGGDREHPVPVCGPQESYVFIARDFRCPGGGPNPFGGDMRLAAGARRGNVGAHAYSGPLTGDPLRDAHVVDLYDVPCPGGPVEVFVCMYHCAAERSLL